MALHARAGDRRLARHPPRPVPDPLAHRTRSTAHRYAPPAAAGPLRSLSAHRHDAAWQALGTELLPGLLAGLSAREPPVSLPVPAEGQEILADYQYLGLSTGRHPLSLLRPRLARCRIHTSQQLRELADGATVRVGGLITHLQRPGTASGVVFISLEDETGIANVIVWPKIFEAQWQIAM